MKKFIDNFIVNIGCHIANKLKAFRSINSMNHIDRVVQSALIRVFSSITNGILLSDRAVMRCIHLLHFKTYL